jgi:hypothetical protein
MPWRKPPVCEFAAEGKLEAWMLASADDAVISTAATIIHLLAYNPIMP